jgi:hypothetical protein
MDARTKAARKGKKYWFTYAFFTREGAPSPAHQQHNFTRSHDHLSKLLADLKGFMRREQETSTEMGNPGAHVVAVWAGQLDEWTALKSEALPLYYVFADHVERL